MERTKLSKAVGWAILSSSVALSGVAYSADSTQGTPSATERGAVSPGDRVRPERQAVQQQHGDRFWASDLIGKDVEISGDRDGEIRDIVVSSQGEVRHIVAEVSGDNGDRLYAIPADKFQAGSDGKVTLNVDQKWLSQRKSWTEDKWPSLTDPGYWSGESAPRQATSAGDMHRLSRLIGQDVKSQQGKEVGEIEDAVVNLKSQKVDFVLFSHDPGITKGERDYAVSVASFKLPSATADGGDAKEQIVLNMSEQQIQSLKPLEDTDKKRINDPGFMSRFENQGQSPTQKQ